MMFVDVVDVVDDVVGVVDVVDDVVGVDIVIVIVGVDVRLYC